MDNKPPALLVDAVSKTYVGKAGTVQALSRVSMKIDAGEIVALVGNNGAGKSTLMSISAGILAADHGHVHVLGEETTRSGGSPSAQLGLVPQEEAIYPTLTAGENLRYFGRLAGLRPPELEARVRSVAQDLLIDDLLTSQASKLSGGQRRRLHVGLALMHRPAVLLLDEPTVGVDIGARRAMLALVGQLAGKGAAIMYSTHQLNDVESVASRAVVIDGGRVLADGAVADLVGQYGRPTAELVFASEVLTIPAVLEPMVDQVSGGDGRPMVMQFRMGASDMSVAELVDCLDDQSRALLQSAAMLDSGFEQAYLRIVRCRTESRTSDDAVVAAEDGNVQ